MGEWCKWWIGASTNLEVMVDAVAHYRALEESLNAWKLDS